MKSTELRSPAVRSDQGGSWRPVVLHVAAVEYTANVLLLPQLRELRRRGYIVRLACAPDAERFSQQLDEFEPVRVAFPRTPRPWAIANASLDFLKTLRRIQPDLVHMHTPAVAFPTRALPRRLLPKHTRVVYTVHGFAHVWDSHRRRDIMWERVERLLAPRTDAMLFQSQEDLEQTERLGYRSRLVYLGNGVEDDWFEIPPLPGPRRPLRALFVGRIIREKGVLDLFEALARVDSVELTVAGGELPSDRDGVESELRRRATEPPLAGRVRFVGLVGRAEMRAHVKAADVLVLPSYREGVPRSLIEGMAAGRPAIASDVRGCRELVRDHTTGFLVPPADVPALAAALARFVAQPESEYVRMSRAARDLASKEYRESRVFGRLVAAYEELGVVVRR
jgi:glycosyltransferase involved in cell wall biosynthesis